MPPQTLNGVLAFRVDEELCKVGLGVVIVGIEIAPVRCMLMRGGVLRASNIHALSVDPLHAPRVVLDISS